MITKTKTHPPEGVTARNALGCGLLTALSFVWAVAVVLVAVMLSQAVNRKFDLLPPCKPCSERAEGGAGGGS